MDLVQAITSSQNENESLEVVFCLLLFVGESGFKLNAKLTKPHKENKAAQKGKVHAYMNWI